MKNFIQEPDLIEINAPAGGVSSGVPVVVGSLIGIPATTAAAGELVVVQTTGVFELPKASATVFAAGAKVSWDATNKVCVVPATGAYPVGLAITAANNGATTVRVRLDGIATGAA